MRQQYVDGIEKVYNLAKKTTTSPRTLRQELDNLCRDMLSNTDELPWTHTQYKNASNKLLRAIRGYENKRTEQARKLGRLKHPFTPILDELIQKFDAKRASRTAAKQSCQNG